MREKEPIGAGKYRHEYKYVCRESTLAIVEGRLCSLMRPDPHAGEAGTYQVRSLYFDDPYGSCFLENENGTDPREK
ncbi:MAG: VTC domain-containing protein, partial [Oscillospiraceae bacterium]|nr:VTC domain-containing protein [Oscillospiraceae bacterium]